MTVLVTGARGDVGAAVYPGQPPAATVPSVFLLSHGRADESGARSGRSWLSRPPKREPAGREKQPPGRAPHPIYATALGFALPEVDVQAPLSVKTFRKRKEKRHPGQMPYEWGRIQSFERCGR